MNDDEQTTRTLTELLPDGPTVAMVTTMVEGMHTSRPVTLAGADDRRISFLVAEHSDWVKAIDRDGATVHVTIADADGSTYLSLNGAASVARDPLEAERLWSPAARVWFDGPGDPQLAVLHFDVSDGEFWDGPSTRLGRAVSMVKAALTGDPESIGSQGAIDAPG